MKLVFENISKLYGDFPALSGINLSLENGVYGLLGPNGVGKTTLMRIMTDLLKPSTGRVLLDGKDIAILGADFRRRLGYLPQDFGFYPNYTAEQYLLYIARLKGLTKFEAKKVHEGLDAKIFVDKDNQISCEIKENKIKIKTNLKLPSKEVTYLRYILDSRYIPVSGELIKNKRNDYRVKITIHDH